MDRRELLFFASMFVSIFMPIIISLCVFCRESNGEQRRTRRASAVWLSIG